MEEGTYLPQLLATIAYLVAGIRLLALCRRTGEIPERLLGIYLILTSLSYVLYLGSLWPELGSWAKPAALGSRIFYDIGVVSFLCFTRRVFRPSETWARWFVWGCGAALFFGVSLSLYVGDWHGEFSNPWYLLEWSGYTVACAWVCAEAFSSYSSASRRVRIGLCDRVTANRFLLWTAFGAFQTVACFALIIVDIDYAVDQQISGWTDALLGGFETAAVIALWLAFFPPAFYRRWLADSDPAPDAIVDG